MLREGLDSSKRSCVAARLRLELLEVADLAVDRSARSRRFADKIGPMGGAAFGFFGQALSRLRRERHWMHY